MLRKYFFPIFILFFSGCLSRYHEESPYLIGQREQPLPAQHQLPRQETWKKTYVIFLDPGHGGEDRGTVSKNKRLQEKNLNLDTARRVERLLMAKGFLVFMSRRKDVFIPLLDRVKMAADRKAQIFVSIHFNFTKNSTIQGAEVFYYAQPTQPVRTKLSRVLGGCILKNLTQSLNTPSRGVKSGNLCVIRETSMPAVLVEAAFLSNPNDARQLLTIEYRRKIAQAIADGIEEYFRVKKEEKTSPARIERAACRLGGDRSIH